MERMKIILVPEVKPEEALTVISRILPERLW